MANENFIKSTKIEIYPTANRGPANSANLYNPGSHLLTENNITGLGHHITERSFVITDSYVSEKDFEFNIKGYYFKLVNFKVSDVISGNPSNVFASIKVLPQNPPQNSDAYDPYSDPNYVITAYNESTPVDSLDEAGANGNCLAVAFTTEAPEAVDDSGYTIYTLHLLEKVNGAWEIPAASHLKLNSHDIKGGEENEEELGLDTYLHTDKVSTNKLTSDENNIEVTTSLTIDPRSKITVSTIKGNAIGSDKLNIDGSTKIEGSLTTASDVNAGNDLHVGSSAYIDGSISVGASADINGNLTVEGKSTLKDDVTLNESLSVRGMGGFGEGISAGALSTFDTINADEVHVTKKFTAGGDGRPTDSQSEAPLQVDGFDIKLLGYPQFVDGLQLNSNAYIDADASGITFRSSKDLKINTTTRIQGAVVTSGRVESDNHIISNHFMYTKEVAWEDPDSVPNIDYINKNTAYRLTLNDNILTLSTANGRVLSQVELLKQIVNMVYPIGSIFMCDHWVNMNELFPGTTWESVKGGNALWSAGSVDSYHSYSPNHYYDAALPSLPNDSGWFTTWGAKSGGESSGSFKAEHKSNLKLDRNTLGSDLGGVQNIYFTPTTYKKPYGYDQSSEITDLNDKLVRPNCYAVYMWRRTA